VKHHISPQLLFFVPLIATLKAILISVAKLDYHCYLALSKNVIPFLDWIYDFKPFHHFDCLYLLLHQHRYHHQLKYVM